MSSIKNVPHVKRVSNLTDSNPEYNVSQSSPSFNHKMSWKFLPSMAQDTGEHLLGSGKDGPVVLK